MSNASPLTQALPWLLDPLLRFRRMLKDDQLPHALLLSGPSGWGKELLAAGMVAALVNRPEPSVEDPLSPIRTAHPDVRWIEPDEEGSGQIRIEQIRALAAFVSVTPTGGATKVAVIAPAERMNLPSANALLKSLEEPPGRACLLLFGDRDSALLPTIRSRCTRFDFAPSHKPAEWLAQWCEPSTSAQDLDAALWLSGGLPLSALALLRDDQLDRVLTVLSALPDARSQSAWAKQASAVPLPLLIDAWMRVLHAARCGAWTPINAMAEATVPAAVQSMWDLLLGYKALLVGTSNPNPQLMLEHLWQAWHGRPASV